MEKKEENKNNEKEKKNKNEETTVGNNKNNEKNNVKVENELEKVNSQSSQINKNNTKNESQKKDIIYIKKEENEDIKEGENILLNTSLKESEKKNAINYIYFIATYSNNKNLNFSLPKEYKENLKAIKKNNIKDNISILWSFKININYLKNNKKIDVIIENIVENASHVYNIEIDDFNKDLYIYNFGSKISEFKLLPYESQYEMFFSLLNNKETRKKTKEYEDFIYSTQKIFEKNKYNLLFYIIFFLECYDNSFASKQLELFNPENIKKAKITKEKLEKIKNIFNKIIENPTIIYLEETREKTDRKKVNELFLSVALFFNINNQTERINEMLNNNEFKDFLYQKFINYLDINKCEYFELSKNHIFQILEKCKNIEQIAHVLFFLGNNIIEFLHTLNSEKNTIKNIVKQNDLDLIININEDYKKPNNKDNIQSLYQEIFTLNETSDLKLIKIAPSIIETYISYNQDNNKNLIIIYQIINLIKNNDYENDIILIEEKISNNIIKLKKNSKLDNTISEDIIESIDFADKNNCDLIKFLMKKLETLLDYNIIKNIYIDLINKYKNITDKTKKLISIFLTQEKFTNQETLPRIMKEFNNIQDFILSNISFKFIIKEEKFLDLNDKNEELNYNLLNYLIQEKIIKRSKNSNIPYIIQTFKAIDNIKNNIETNNLNFNDLNGIIEEKRQDILYKRVFTIYLLDKTNTDNHFNNIKSEIQKIKEKIKEFEVVQNFFKHFFNKSKNEDIIVIGNIIKLIKENNLNYIKKEEEKCQKYIQFYNTGKDALNKNRSKFFKLIYEHKKSLKDENQSLNETLNEFNNFDKLFRNNEIDKLNEGLILFVLKCIQNDELINEIKILKEIFDKGKNLYYKIIIKDLLIISENYIFKIIEGIKSFIDIVNAKKTEYSNIINDTLSKKNESIDNNSINKIHNYINDLNKLNIDINDYENNEYITILIILSEDPDIILFLFEINKCNIFDKLNDKKNDEIIMIKNCCDFLKNLLNIEDSKTIQLLKKNLTENKDILKDFQNLLKDNCLYNYLLSHATSFFKDLILKKELVSKLLKKSKNFNDISQLLIYLGKDIISFLDFINTKKDLIFIYNKKKENLLELEKYIIPKKEDNLNIINRQINCLVENKIIDYIKFSPLIFEKYDEINLVLLNTIINLLRANDKECEWDILIHNNILKLVKNGKIKNLELLNMIQKDNIYNNEKYKDLRTLEIMDGIDISTLNDEFFNKWKSIDFPKIFKLNIEQFYEKITSLIKEIKDFKFLFYFFNKENNEFNKYILKRFEEMLSINKENISIDVLVDLILYTDKNELTLKINIMEKMQNALESNIINDIYLKLEKELLSEESKDLIAHYLINSQTIDNFIKLLKQFNNIRKNILQKIDNKFIIKEEKFFDNDNVEENEKYNLLKELTKIKIFKEKNEFKDIQYIKQTNEVINKLKNNIESYNVNYNIVNNIIKEKKQEFLFDRIKCIYLLDEEKSKVSYNNLINKVKEINEKIEELQLISNYLNKYLKNSSKNHIDEINEIMNSLKKENIKYLDNDNYKKYFEYYNKAKDIANRNRSKFFQFIYENKPLSKDENQRLNETLNEFNTFDKLFKQNEYREINEGLILFIIQDIQNEDLINEIKILNEIFNEGKNKDNEKIIKELLIFSKNYIFKIIIGIKSFIDIVNAKKTEYSNIIDKLILIKDEIIDNNSLNKIHNYINDLNKLNIDINDYENNDYIKILITLSDDPDIILFLSEINKCNIFDVLNEGNNELIIVKNCCYFLKNLFDKELLANFEDKNIIELLKNCLNKNKNKKILKDFQNLLKDNCLYNYLFSHATSFFKDLILKKELVSKLLEKSKNFNEFSQSLLYIGKDIISFLDFINTKKDLIFIYNKNKKNSLELEKYIIPKKEDNLKELNRQINCLAKNKIIDYIKFSPLIFEKYDEINLELLNTIINLLRVNDKECEWDILIHNNILKLVKNGKIKNLELLNMIQKDNIYNNEKYKDLRTLEIMDGIDISTLNDEFFNKWKSIDFTTIFKLSIEQFYIKITSLIKEIKDFKILFLFYKENNEFNKHILKRFEEVLSANKKNINIDSLVDLILYTDQKKLTLKNNIMEVIKNTLETNIIIDIYLKLEKELLSEECKDLIAYYLTNSQTIDNFIKLLKQFNNIRKNILQKVDNKFIIKEEKFFDNVEENEKYNLLKELTKINIFKEKNEFKDIQYIKQTNEVINKIKNNIESYNINYNIVNNIIKEKKQDFLFDRIKYIYLLDEEKSKVSYNNLINKIKEINKKINELQLIAEYLNKYHNKSSKNHINEINRIINSLQNENLNYLDAIEIKKYIKNYNKEKDIFYIKESEIFNKIYNGNKSTVIEEEIHFVKSLNEYEKLSKLFQNNGIFEINEELLKKCFNYNSNSKDIDFNNEINILNKVFNNNKSINNKELINDIKIILKKNYFFEAISAIINFLDNIGIKNSEYSNNLKNILLNKEKKDINYLRKCFDDLKIISNDIIKEENCEYIELLIELVDHGDIIQFLLELNEKSILSNLNDEKKNKVNDIKICSELFENLDLKNKKDNELIERFKKDINEKKDIINNFKNLINNNNLYSCFYNYRNDAFKNLILSKELVYKLLEKSKDFNDILNSLSYLEKDTILFFNVLKEKNDLIIKNINNNKNNIIELKQYIIPKKEDNLEQLNDIIYYLTKTKIKNHIKYNPNFFNLYIEEENKNNINKINNIINELKAEDNKKENDLFIQKNIITLIKKKYLKNKDIIEAIKKYDLINLNNDLSLDLLEGVELSSLHKDNIFNDLEELYTYKKEEFYEKIVSKAKNMDDLEILFLSNTKKNQKLEKIIKFKFNELTQEYIKEKNEDELIKSIHLADKYCVTLRDNLVDEFKKQLDFDTINNIYINTIGKYNDLSIDLKNIIAKHLTEGKNWDRDFLIKILKKCIKIKNKILISIDEKISVTENDFLKINDNKINNDYNLVQNIFEEKIILNFDKIPKIHKNFENLKSKINQNNFIYNDLTPIFNEEQKNSLLKKRLLCIYFLNNNDMVKNYKKIKDKYDKIKDIIEELKILLKLNEYFRDSCPKDKIDEIIRLLQEKDLNYFEKELKNKEYKEYKEYIEIIKSKNLINKSESEIFKKIYNDKKIKIKNEKQCIIESSDTFDNYNKLFSPQDINDIDINLLYMLQGTKDKYNELNTIKKIFNIYNPINNDKLIDDINNIIKKHKIKKILMIIIPILLLVLIFSLNLLSKAINVEPKENKNEINWNIFNISKDLVKSEEKLYDFVELPLQKEKNNPTNKEKLIVGIDFGTINTKISYIKDNNDISKIDFIGSTLNEIEISRNTNKGQKYSNKASSSLRNYGKNELSSITFVKGIKTIFSFDKLNDDNLCYIFPSEYISDFNIKNILKEYFIMIQKDIWEKTLSQQLNKDRIKWIIAVPYAWNEFAKQLIYNAAYESGMINLNLIYDSEAAALAMLYDNGVDKKFKEKNKIFMLIDAGGYYSNITINEIIDKDKIKEKIKLKNNIINNVGIVTIVEEIIKVMEQIYGKNSINKLKKEKPGEWTETLHEINKIIEKVYSIDGIEEYDIKSRFKTRGQYDYLYKTEKGVQNYNIKYNDFSLVFPGRLLGNIIYNNGRNISDNIDRIINEMKSKKMVIDSLVVTGGLSKNQIFIKEIEKKFNKIPINYLSSYEKVVSKGAVIYGIDSNKIKSRISPITFGIRKKGQNENEIEILIKKGEEIENYSISRFIKPSSKEQEIIQLNIYISENNKEKLNENDIFGRLLLYIKKNYNEIIQLKISYDTALKFNAIDYKSQKEIKTVFEFFK